MEVGEKSQCHNFHILDISTICHCQILKNFAIGTQELALSISQLVCPFLYNLYKNLHISSLPPSLKLSLVSLVSCQSLSSLFLVSQQSLFSLSLVSLQCLSSLFLVSLYPLSSLSLCSLSIVSSKGIATVNHFRLEDESVHNQLLTLHVLGSFVHFVTT